ncbi:1498_t:CDS:1, partial [Paraglomus brasilianum]
DMEQVSAESPGLEDIPDRMVSLTEAVRQERIVRARKLIDISISQAVQPESTMPPIPTDNVLITDKLIFAKIEKAFFSLSTHL